MPIVLVVLVLAGCGGGDGPAAYVGRASNSVLYVTWTRSGDALSGQLTQALASDDVSAGTVETQRVGFEGTIEAKSVSLRLDQGLGTTTLTGRLDGGTLVLDYPGKDGGVITIKLRKGDNEAFNADLAALRDRTTQAKQDADQAAAEQQALEETAAAEQQAFEDAAAAAESVRTAIGGLDQAAENATANGPDLYASDLDTIKSDLDVVRSSYEVLTQDVAAGNRETVCDDASVVGDDVDNLSHDVGSLHSDVKDNSDPDVLGDEVRDLREQYAAMRSLDASTLPGDVPDQDDVDAAIAAARQKVRTQGRRGANLAEAEKLLAKARALHTQARAACQAHGT